VLITRIQDFRLTGVSLIDKVLIQSGLKPGYYKNAKTEKYENAEHFGTTGDMPLIKGASALPPEILPVFRYWC
jgi:hypothetical protein